MAKITKILQSVCFSAIVFVFFFLIVGSTMAVAEDQESTDSSGFEEQDAGLDTIDVSKYPEEIQEYYTVLQEKCSECHALARVINSKFALPDEWKRYIKRMRRKPGSKIKKADAKKIWEFLVYDSKQRKQDLIKASAAQADSAKQKE